MNVGFIGAGNMGGALARAAAKSQTPSRLYIADNDTAKAQALAQELGAATADNAGVIAACDVVFLGLKPQILPKVLPQLAAWAGEKKGKNLFVSMAAGVTISTLLTALGEDCPVIRIMPNTPVSVGTGMIMYDCAPAVTGEQEKAFLDILSQAGRVDRLPEHLIDAGCAVSACGPAFVCLFAEALADGGVACGLPRDKALEYAAQMLCGTAELLLRSGQHPGVLKDAVCSPGGSTIRGVQALEENGFRGAVMDAVLAAYKRTVELG